MADASELKQPGMEILVSFKTTSPTVITPMLMPCIVGPCLQSVEVLATDAAGNRVLNESAKAGVPAYVYVAQDGPYTTLDGKSLGLEVNNSPVISVTFAGTSISKAVVVAKINEALEANNLADQAFAFVTTTGWYLRTRAAGDLQSIRVSAPAVADRAVLTAFGMYESRTHFGAAFYAQKAQVIPQFGYPDPRANMAELVISAASTRGFLYMGTGTLLQEMYKNQTLLRHGIVGATNHIVTAIAPQDDGDGDSLTPIIRFTGEDFTAEATDISVTGSSDLSVTPAGVNDKTITLDAGAGPQTFTFRSVAAAADIVTQLNGAFGDVLTVSLSTNNLKLTTKAKGTDAYLRVVGGTAATALGIDSFTSKIYSGDAATTAPAIRPFKPFAGDDLYANGIRIGRIVQVAPGGVVTDLKIDTEVPVVLGTTWTSYYIVARNLPAPTAIEASRPVADLRVDSTTGAMTVKRGLVRDTQGTVTTANMRMYIMYNALRKDVTVKSARKPSLLRLDSTDKVSALISPLNATNPLGLASYYALLNSSNAQVQALGVDAISADEPDGTAEAYGRAFTFLESKEVYAIAPLSRTKAVCDLGKSHAETMSDPENKGERVVIVSRPVPTHAVDDLVTSGTDGNTDGSSPKKFDTGIANLPSLLMSAGIDPSQPTFSVGTGIYLDIEDDGNHYSVESVSGSVLTLRQASNKFLAGENDDGFYSTTLIGQCIGSNFSVLVRGDALVLPDGSPDKDAIADTYQDYGRAFGSRRLWHLVLDTVEASIGGVTTSLPAQYFCAAYAGMIGGQPPQQSFTNFPVTGFTKVTGTNDYFGKRQLNRIAAGGNTIIIQDPEDTGPIFARMALTTDMSSIETRTDSITKCLDFSCKFWRISVRNYLGRFNVNQGYLDTLSHVLQGCHHVLMSSGVLVDAETNNIIQEENNPDSVAIGITVDVPYPANYINVNVIV